MNEKSPVGTGAVSTFGGRLVSYWTSLDYNLRLIMVIGLIEAASVNGYIAVLMPYYRALGFDSKIVGSFNSVQNMVGMVLGMAGGLLADTFGRKRMYMLGQLARTLAVTLLLMTGSFTGLIIIAVLRGMATIQFPAQSALLAGYTSRRNRATMLGVFQTLAQLAAVVAPIVAGIGAEVYGVKVPFAAALILSVSAVFLAIPLKERTGHTLKEAQQESERARPPFASRLVQMFSGPRRWILTLLLLASLVNGTANGATNIILPFTVMDRFSSAYTAMSNVQAFFALGTMLVLLLGGRLADVKGRRTVVMTSGVVFPVLMCGVLFVRSLWQLCLVGMLITMAGNISSPAIGAAYMEAVEEKDRATFAGLHLGLNSLGMALGSFLGGFSYALNPLGSWIWVIALFSSQVIVYHIVLPRE